MKPDPDSRSVDDLVHIGLSSSKNELKTADYNVHGVVTRVLTNSEAVAGAIAKFLQHFPSLKDSAEPQITVHLFVLDSLDDDMLALPDDADMLYDWGLVKVLQRESQRYLRVDTRARVIADVQTLQAVGFAEENLLQSDWLMSNLFFYPLWAQLLKVAGLFPLHAAGLGREGLGFLFLGKSGSGKSTLSLHMVKMGYGLLSDDTVFLRLHGDEVQALSFPEEINVNDDTVQMLPELGRIESFTRNDLREKSSFPIEELYPGCVIESTRPGIMAFPEIVDSEETTLRPMSQTEALALSLRYGFFFLDPSTTAAHFEILSRLARQSKCYRLYSGRNQQELEQAVDRLLAGSLNEHGEKDD